MTPTIPQSLVTVPLLAILAAATVIDLRTHRLPNVLTFGAALFGLVLQGTLHGFAGTLLAAAGWAVCMALFLPFYAARGMAAGDVKLMAAVGTFLGPGPGIVAVLFTMIAGGLIGLAAMAAFRVAHARSPAPGTESARSLACRHRIPYAGAIAAGTSLVVLAPELVPPALIRIGALI